MIITTLRRYEDRHTDGVVYVDGEKLGVSLEDIGRPHGVKHPGETCIPEGTYKVAISHSPKYQRDMLILYNRDDDHSIERHGVRFTGIRMHGGNRTEHTAGCPIMAEHTDRKGSVWGSLETVLFDLVRQAIDAGEEVLWVMAEDV